MSPHSAEVDVPSIVLVTGDESVTIDSDLNHSNTDRGVTEAKESNDSCEHPETSHGRL